MPRPVQSGQAPHGELNEKLRGSSSGTLVPQFGHAAPWLNSRSSAPSRATANAIESNVKQLSYEKVLCDPVSTLRQPAKIAKYKWGKIFSLWPTIAIKKIVF